MPIQPQEIKRSVDRKSRPDTMGEEGILHIVEQNDERYFAKQWYKNHDTQLAVSPEHGGSPMSPYWHKLKFYEYQLIHDVFPDATVEMVGGFDPRIKKEADGSHSFDMSSGRPFTVTKEVLGDPIKTAQVRNVLDQAYALMLPYRDAVRGRPKNDAGEAAFMRVVFKADQAIQEILGKELHLEQFQGGYTSKEFERLIATVKQVDPNSRMIALLECGVVPIHPEFNFIPGTKETHPQSPHGVFIECAIRDINRFRLGVNKRFIQPQQAADKAALNAKMERYLLYRTLDQMFDHFLRTPLGPKEAWKFDPAVQTAIFHLLEYVKKIANKRPINDAMVQGLLRDVIGKFVRGFSASHVATLLETEMVKPLAKQK